MPELAFRPATPDDIPALRSLAETIWRSCYPGIISPAQIEYMLHRMYAPEVIREDMAAGTQWTLALQGERPVGFLAFDPDATGIQLHKLYLQPELHGQGQGQRMLEHVRSEALRRKAARISLRVNKANLRALRAYERAGFRQVDSVVADIGGGFVMDDFLLELELAAPV